MVVPHFFVSMTGDVSKKKPWSKFIMVLGCIFLIHSLSWWDSWSLYVDSRARRGGGAPGLAG